MKQQTNTPQSMQEETKYTQGELKKSNGDDNDIKLWVRNQEPNPGNTHKCIAILSDDNKEADAARIVECWNGYDKLQAENEALKEANKEMIESFKQMLILRKETGGSQPYIDGLLDIALRNYNKYKKIK